MKSSAYHFHMKIKILTDFQICISVPLIDLSQLKSTSGQTKASSLLSFHYENFITDLVLVFAVIIRQFVFVTMSIFGNNFGTFV